jgi:hypothetical protein
MKTVLLYGAIAFTAALLLYITYGRPWLKDQPWSKPFFDWVEPIEIFLFKKSETILFARLKIFGGLLLTFLAQVGTMDLSPLLGMLPEQHRPLAQFAINLAPMLLTFIGMADERLRNTTTKPLELVALPEAKPLPPEVAAVVQAAEEVKAEAVAVVKESGSV